MKRLYKLDSPFHKLTIVDMSLHDLKYLGNMGSDDLYYECTLNLCVLVGAGSMVTSPVHISKNSRVPGIRKIYELLTKDKEGELYVTEGDEESKEGTGIIQ